MSGPTYYLYLDTELVTGDLDGSGDLHQVMKGSRVVVHIANIRYSPSVVNAAMKAGAGQIVLVHTTGMFSKYRAYAEEYRRIEKVVLDQVQGSSCRYTLIRPTMIYGGWQDHNFHKLIRFLRYTPVFPVFGDGSGKMQPVHAEDLADCIANAIDNPLAYDMAFNIAGGSVHSYKGVVNMTARLLGRRVLLVQIPFGLALAVVSTLALLRQSFISVEQVRRLAEDKVFDQTLAFERLNHKPRDLETGLRQQIGDMGLRRDSYGDYPRS